MNVQLPDKSIVQFPDDMPENQINSAISDHLSANQSQAVPAGMGAGFVKGMEDPFNGVAQLMLHYGPDRTGLGDLDPARSLDTRINTDEDQYQKGRAAAGRDGIDWSRLAGSLVPTAPLAMALPAATGGVLPSIVKGALAGGVFGATQPVNDSKNFDEDKLNQVALSSGTGGALGPLIGALSKITNPTVSNEVQSLLDQGITPTPGKILGGNYAKFEDKLSSVPFLGDLIKNGQTRALDQFNIAALGRAMQPISAPAPQTIGRTGLKSVKDTLGQAYDNLLPKLQFKTTPQYIQDLGNLRNLAQNMPEQQSKQFNNIIKTQIDDKLSATGSMDGKTYKGVEEELNAAAKGYTSDSSYDNRQLGNALKEALNLTRKNLQSSNPRYADQLSSINQGYANYAILRNAGSKLGANGENEMGAFTPAQLQSAVRAADKSAGKGNFATGNAKMQDLSDAGVSILGSKYPDPGTAGREMLGVALGTLLEGGGHALGHTLLPIAGAATLAAPYTKIGQKLAAALLTKRPDFAEPLANALQKSSPLFSAGGGQFAAQGASQ